MRRNGELTAYIGMGDERQARKMSMECGGICLAGTATTMHLSDDFQGVMQGRELQLDSGEGAHRGQPPVTDKDHWGAAHCVSSANRQSRLISGKRGAIYH